MKPVVVLGATGSIGRQALEVADHLGWEVVGLASRGSSPSWAGVADLATRYPQARVVVARPGTSDHQTFQEQLGPRYCRGDEAVVELASQPGTIVVNGIVGVEGLAASVAAVRAGNRLALANKESLVAGGPLLRPATHEGEIIPVDSEHSALFQCLHGEQAPPARLILTASGGPFRGMSADCLEKVTVAQALAHPTWQMGQRITVDSATLVNKGMEVMEAHFLFGLDYDQIEVVVHPQSIVHSMVEFADGSVKAHLGLPDMRIPLQYALTFPDRAPGRTAPFDPTSAPLTFEAPDRQAFPALNLAYAAGRQGGTMPAVFNAADEVAVEAFLLGQISFTDVAQVIAQGLEAHERSEVESVEQVLEVDREARAQARRVVKGRTG